MRSQKTLLSLAITGSFVLSNVALADEELCGGVTRDALIAAAKSIVPGDTYLLPGDGSDKTPNGGFDLPMWVSVVDTDGTVCHVINTAAEGQSLDKTAYVGNQSWLGSRVISAQKANTANAFSLDYYTISTANLFGTVQGNNSLFGLQHSNPVDTYNAYSAPGTDTSLFATATDPMIGKVVGGVNVFGGGLALYTTDGLLGTTKVGAIGVSGDTSCTDHTVAWKIRKALELDNVPRGPISQGDLFNNAGGALSLRE
ncbi:heme-binding protein, partial [Bathymodiolus platifrons methanotrophic gill symbiont]|uniref:heme-binding protein n=1 Tax=Bathymodiolus platifrons methanotrophic gill symbiont TaxID=113268 RepID=UPI001FCD3D1B